MLKNNLTGADLLADQQPPATPTPLKNRSGYIKKYENTRPLHILSLGAGVQSSALYLMSALGEIPPFDSAIFADTGAESTRTLEYLNKLIGYGEKHNGAEIVKIGKHSLYDDCISFLKTGDHNNLPLPLYTPDQRGHYSMTKRQCTQAYKIRLVHRAIRLAYGITDRSWTPPTFVYLGISSDEISRMSNPLKKWERNVYPLIGFCFHRDYTYRSPDTISISRAGCEAWLIKKGFEVPPKSSCTFCPYMDDHRWQEVQKLDPIDFEKACVLDDLLRTHPPKGFKGALYLHRSCKPLRAFPFQTLQFTIFQGCESGHCAT